MNDCAPALRAFELCKTFGRGRSAVRALDRVSLAVPAARITGLVGPNGAGKSTLLHAMLGLVRPDSGRCEIWEAPATRRDARAGIGFLPEEVSYEAGFTVGEIVRLHARLAGVETRDQVTRTLRRFGLRGLPARRVAHCSLGTARRLALACAFLGTPRLLVLDEPTSGLDVEARTRLLEDLVDFRRRGGTVLLSSHVLSELEAVCDEVVILRGGRIDGIVGVDELARTYSRRTGP